MKNDESEESKKTIAVQSDPSLMLGIEEGLSSLREGKAKLYTLDEFFNPQRKKTSGDH